MRKRAFNMVEIMIVICLLVTTVVVCLPIIFNNSKQAKIISGWKKMYAEVESNFEVFSVSDNAVVEKICSGNFEDKEGEVFKVVSPYLNVDLGKSIEPLKSYNYKFNNGAQVSMQSEVFTRKFGLQDNGNIVGFKMINCGCDEKTPCASVIFDMNGLKKPNRIGQDIFAVYLFKGHIEAFGSNRTNEQLEKDCSKRKSGVNCSEYYLRGGKF